MLLGILKPLPASEVLLLKWHPLSSFGLALGEMLLHHTENLSRTLQHDHVSADEGQAIATTTTATPASLENDEHFDLFWEKV